jgi:hypothetical protein
MELVRAILIHAVVPFAGVALFLELRQKMLEADIEEPPTVALFILFATYGGWIVVILTLLFWYWSGMATLGFAYLMLAAPIVTLGLATAFYRRRRLSGYHAAGFWLNAVYVPWLLLLGAARVVYYGLSWREFF